MRIGAYYKSSLSGLTFRYKGFIVGINIQGNDARVWAERVLKVMDDRMAFKTENVLDLEFKFKEDGADVMKFAEELEVLVKAFVTSHQRGELSASQPDQLRP